MHVGWVLTRFVHFKFLEPRMRSLFISQDPGTWNTPFLVPILSLCANSSLLNLYNFLLRMRTFWVLKHKRVHFASNQTVRNYCPHSILFHLILFHFSILFHCFRAPKMKQNWDGGFFQFLWSKIIKYETFENEITCQINCFSV